MCQGRFLSILLTPQQCPSHFQQQRTYLHAFSGQPQRQSITVQGLLALAVDLKVHLELPVSNVEWLHTHTHEMISLEMIQNYFCDNILQNYSHH